MNNEQNIADLIEQLMTVAKNPSDETEPLEDKTSKKREKNMSADDLHKKLIKQYSANGSSSEKERSPYDLDADLLNEFVVSNEEEFVEEDVIDAVEEEEIVEEEIIEDVLVEDEMLDEDEDEEIAFDQEPLEDADKEIVDEENAQPQFDEAYDDLEPSEDEAAILEELEVLEDYEDIEPMAEEPAEQVEEYAPNKKGKEVVEEIGFSDDDIYGKPLDPVTEQRDDTYIERVDTDSQSKVEYLDEDIYESSRQTVADDEVKEETDSIAEADEQIENDETPIIVSEPFNEFTYQEKTKPVSFKAMMMDYGRSDPTPDEDVTLEPELIASDEVDTPDVDDILSDFSDPRAVREENIKSEMQRIMSSFGCEEELKDIPREALGEMFGEFGTVSDEIDEEQRRVIKMEERRERYRKDNIASIFRLVICAISVIAMFFYDTLPLLDIEFVGLLDYATYPGAYVMMGFQLLLISAVCLWKPMIDGIKKLATPRPNIYSMVTLIVCANLLYDLVLVISGSYEPDVTPVFHFLGGVMIFFVAITELILQFKESKAYDIYCSDVAKYTLSKDGGPNSIAEKMYNGGFSKEKEIYAPMPMSDIDGFDKVIRGNSNLSRVNSLILPIASVICIITGIVLMIVGRSPQMSFAAAMVILYSVVPVGAVIAIAMPLEAAASRLTKRGIAIASRKMINKYADANVLVFMDTHLFKKCSSKDVGFVCYEKSQTNGIIAALEILYSRIGGPMSDVFSNIPDEMRAKRIRVRRVAKNGIEALVDKNHVLIVGDAEFMRRYGINFSGVETKSKQTKNATLYISYDGRASAKLSAVYEVDPVFDMLIERFAEEGGHCVIETYDPVINTTFVANQRRKGSAPISVVHKNSADINRCAEAKPKRVADNGIIVVSSRFKLIEAVVWCIRIVKIERIANILTYCFAGLGFALTMLAAIFGLTPFMAQYLLLLYALLPMIIVGVVTFTILPDKDHFVIKK